MTGPVPTADLIGPADIFAGLQADSASSVIATLAGHLQRQGKVHDSYGAAVEARERSMPTGLPLEDGLAVAVPHTDPEHVIRSSVAIATLQAPVTFRSMDDPDRELPVRVVFLLALRSKEEQLDMLGAIGALLQDGAMLQRLSEARDPQQVFTEVNQHLKLGG